MEYLLVVVGVMIAMGIALVVGIKIGEQKEKDRRDRINGRW